MLPRQRWSNTAVALGHPPTAAPSTAAGKGVALEIGSLCYLGDEGQILLQASMLYPLMAG